MGFARQVWTLTRKTLLIVVARHWFATLLRAILLPIIFEFFISYAKNLFVPPSEFGIASPTPIRSFTDALHASDSTRHTVAFVNNGHTGGAIESVINELANTARQAGKDVQILRSETELLSICRSSLRGTTACYGAASFLASPDEGSGGRWNYTLRADGELGTKIYVNRNDNDAELYVLPFQRAIDSIIVTRSNSSLPDTVNQYPFTSQVCLKPLLISSGLSTNLDPDSRRARRWHSTPVHASISQIPGSRVLHWHSWHRLSSDWSNGS